MPAPSLIDCQGLTKAFGGDPLFEDISFTLHEGDHVALVGPNGSGKSTFLKILAGTLEPDSGQRRVRKHLSVGYVPQDPVFAPGKTVEEVLLEALAEAPGVDEGTRWERLALGLGKAGFDDGDTLTDTLSGGWRKRLAIARELALAPEVLLLDEPTNHLDVQSIVWLEELLAQESQAFVAVSHDRYFLEAISRRVLELDRRYAEGLFAVDGTYSDFLEARDERLRRDAADRETLANLAAKELEWLRRGPKARTSKSKSRIDSAQELFSDLADAERRAGAGRAISAGAQIDFSSSGRHTKRLWKGEGLAKGYGDGPVFEDLDLLLTPGKRVGIVGANGSGKTTFLRVLVGEAEPDAGTIETADRLRTVYFEQNRESLDPDLTLERALSPRGDQVEFGGRHLHVVSWAKRFLFRPEQLRTPVGALSGGERSRIVLARLMLKPADLLVLDEPTNDLDIPTLDVLEEALLEFPGAVVLVTHDRFLLDRVATEVLAFDGDGGVGRYADLAQWLAAEEAKAATAPAPSPSPPPGPPPAASPPPAGDGPKKLSYHEQREWDGMEDAVLAAEARLERAQEAADDPSIATNAALLQERSMALAEASAEVERLYARWAELEERVKAYEAARG